MVTAADALLVIDWLSGRRSAGVTLEQLDTDANQRITPRDALRVINWLHESTLTIGVPRSTAAPSLSARDVDQLFSNRGLSANLELEEELLTLLNDR